MANLLYNTGLLGLLKAATAFEAGTYKALLERSTSSYSPDKDHTSLLDQAGLVLITVGSYTVKTLGTKAVTVDNDNDRVSIDCGNVEYGTLETGQTVKAVIVYRDDGGNGVPLLYLDTDSGGLLPRALGGGDFTIAVAAAGLLTGAQA